MFKHILVPVDGSATSEVAVGKAIELAKAFDSSVTVIYVIDPGCRRFAGYFELKRRVF